VAFEMSESAESKPRNPHRCPFCAQHLEIADDCGSCGGTVQDRVAWLALTTLRLMQPGATILHHMPRAALARRLYALFGPQYHATIPPGTEPPVPDIAFHAFDPATQATDLASASYRIIIIGAGLNQAGAAVPATLEALANALTPGGSLLFGGDVVDADGAIANKELAVVAMAGRTGVSSFAGMVRRQFKRDCRIRAGIDLSNATIDQAGVQPALMRRVTPQTLFWYQA
jgi:hypothetical protein